MYKPCGYCNAMESAQHLAKADFTAFPADWRGKLYTIEKWICAPFYRFVCARTQLPWHYRPVGSGQAIRTWAGISQPLVVAREKNVRQKGAFRCKASSHCGNKLSLDQGGCKAGWERGATLGRKAVREPPHHCRCGGLSQGSVTRSFHLAVTFSGACDRL